MSNQHVLKIHPAPLVDLLSGAKTAEVRRNDRGFQVGDTVRLMEVNPETGNWTGAADHVRTISHIQTGYGLPDGLCVLSYADTGQAQLAEAVGLLEQLTSTGCWDVSNSALVERACDIWMAHRDAKHSKAKNAQAEQLEAQSTQAGDEHESFEAWHRSVVAGDPPHEKYHDGSYVNQHVNRYWTGWLARAALATQPAAGKPVFQLRNPKIGPEWNEVDRVAYEEFASMPAYERRTLWTAPPAAAHGDEAVAVVGTVPDGSGFKSLDFKVDLQDLPDGTKLYARRSQGDGEVQ